MANDTKQTKEENPRYCLQVEVIRRLTVATWRKVTIRRPSHKCKRRKRETFLFFLDADRNNKNTQRWVSSRYSWLIPGSRWFQYVPSPCAARLLISRGLGVRRLTFSQRSRKRRWLLLHETPNLPRTFSPRPTKPSNCHDANHLRPEKRSGKK